MTENGAFVEDRHAQHSLSALMKCQGVWYAVRAKPPAISLTSIVTQLVNWSGVPLTTAGETLVGTVIT